MIHELNKDNEVELGKGIEDRIAWLTISRPEANNAMNAEMMAVLLTVAAGSMKKNPNSAYGGSLGDTFDREARHKRRCVMRKDHKGIARAFAKKERLSSVVFHG